MKKTELPSKLCAACGRPFAWRRKWARDWESVRFCSDACRSGRRARAVAAGREAGGRSVLPLDGEGVDGRRRSS